MRPARSRALVVATAALAALAVTGPSTAHATEAAAGRHVLVLSIDGMHQFDLDRYVALHPDSALAQLVHAGTDYANASTTFPSDSFPGMIAQFTGAGPGTAGVYYDDTYNHQLLPPGTTNCANAPLGTEVAWTEAADRSQDPLTLDAGQGIRQPALTNLPTNTTQQTLDHAAAITRSILRMTPRPQHVLDPAALPVDPATCAPLYPHQYLRVNTVFEVARSAGLRTAWSDKHPAYEILNGPSGTGIQDLFTPEINSVADSLGNDWTTDNALTQEYDHFKVAAVLDEIAGYNHQGTKTVGTPAIFGMNFQTLSTAQKLPTSDGLRGGYNPDGTPGPLVTRALDYVNGQVGELTAALAAHHLSDSTTVILSAKHGQAPVDPSTLRRVDDGAVLDGLNAAWAATHPGAPALVDFSVDDDVMLLWLSDDSSTARRFATRWLLGHSAAANTVNDPKGVFSTSVASSGLQSVATGAAADRLFGAVHNDRRTPDLVGVVQPGVVYTGNVKKISEHGGTSAEDRHVPLVVSGGGVAAGVTVAGRVQTTQIAPTILQLLGLDPAALQGVRKEGTAVLPAS